MKTIKKLWLFMFVCAMALTTLSCSKDSDKEESEKLVECAFCDGTGLCDNCHGTGICPTCYGTGIYNVTGKHWSTCFECDGDGECKTCRGDKKCKWCGGTGKL